MSVSLVSSLRDLLLKIKNNPKESFAFSKIYADELLLRKMKDYVVQISKGNKHERQIIQNEILNNGIEEIVKPILLKLDSIGYTYPQNNSIIESSLFYAISFIINNYPMHICWHPFRSGIEYPSKEVEQIDHLINLTSTDYFSPYTELKYAIENCLLTWNCKVWNVTPIGDLFLSLSPTTATVFLLKLEIYLNQPGTENAFDFNPYHMSHKFLQKLYEAQKVYVDLGDARYTLLEDDPNMTYLSRIQDFDLVYTNDLTLSRRSQDEIEGIQMIYIGDDFFETLLTDFGREVIGQAINSENKFLGTLIENLIKIEISGAKYFEFHDKKDNDELLNLAANNKEILNGQYSVIKDIVQHINAGKPDIHLLRSLYPSIESILKKILTQEKLMDSSEQKLTLFTIIARFRSVLDKKPILRKETLDYLSSMDRNNILHGSITPTDQLILWYLNLTLNFLSMVLKDYENHRLAKKKL